MSAEHAYGDALANAPATASIGMKAAVEAINDDEFGMAADFLRAAAGHLEDADDA